MFYAEYCENVKKRRGFMVPTTSLDNLTGFRSVYEFSEEDAKLINSTHSSAGLQKYKVHSNFLPMDFDDNEAGMKEAVKFCKDKHLGYKLYHTGGRGFHLFIPTVECYSENVPYTHKCMAEQLNVGADICIYRSSSLIRLPNTLHERTGKPKILIEEDEGEYLLDVKIREPKSRGFTAQFPSLTEYQELRWGLDEVVKGMQNCPGKGSRHQYLWSVAKDLSRGGLSYETVLELLLTLNRSWENDAKDDQEAEQSIRQGFTKNGR